MAKATNIRSLNLHVEGKENTSITVSTGKSSVTYHDENKIIDILQSFMSEGIVKPGRYLEEFAFQIPEEALPSYEGRNSKISYEVKAWINIPKHFDIKSSKKFIVKSLQKEFGEPIEAASQVQNDISYTTRKLEPTISVRSDHNNYNAGEPIRAALFSKEFAQAKRTKTDRFLHLP